MRSRVALLLTVMLIAPLACEGWEPVTLSSDDVVAATTGPMTLLERRCHTFCDHAVELGCEDPSCAFRCIDAIENAGNCQDVTMDYVACIAAEGLTDCTVVPTNCEPAYDQWTRCASPGGCGVVQCIEPGDFDCRCQAFCGEEETLYVERCVENLNGGFHCTCQVDDVVEVECVDEVTACAFFVGCCSLVIPQPQP